MRRMRGMSLSRPRARRSVFDVGRSVFLFLQRHQFHPALRTVAGVFSYDLGMHHAGVFLPFLLLLLLIVLLLMNVHVIWAIGGNRPYLRGSSHRQHKCARDYDCNLFSHFVWL